MGVSFHIFFFPEFSWHRSMETMFVPMEYRLFLWIFPLNVHPMHELGQAPVFYVPGWGDARLHPQVAQGERLREGAGAKRREWIFKIYNDCQFSSQHPPHFLPPEINFLMFIEMFLFVMFSNSRKPQEDLGHFRCALGSEHGHMAVSATHPGFPEFFPLPYPQETLPHFSADSSHIDQVGRGQNDPSARFDGFSFSKWLALC